MEAIKKSAEDKMKKAVKALEDEFKTIRTGRASAALFEHIRVDYYEQKVPLSQVATISIPEARLVIIQPWDRSVLPDIEKAIQKSELSVNPNNDGKVIRIAIPPLTEERRKELVKVVRRYAEDGKIAIRNVRRDVMKHLEELVKNGDVGDDEERRAEAQVQKLTDDNVKALDDLLKHKEAEIMEV